MASPEPESLMRPLLTLALILMTATGCARLAESRLNPLNWFERSTPMTAVDRSQVRPLVPEVAPATDPRALIARVTGLVIESTPDGAIIRATGTAQAAGYFNAELVPVGLQDGVLTYEFRVAAPPAPVSGAATPIAVATVLTAAELQGLTAIQVVGATDGRTARR
jgi:hypothetical protein